MAISAPNCVKAGINAALKAVARIRDDAELPPGGRGAQGIEIGRFQENIVGRLRAARASPPIMPAMPFGGIVIGDDGHVAVSE